MEIIKATPDIILIIMILNFIATVTLFIKIISSRSELRTIMNNRHDIINEDILKCKAIFSLCSIIKSAP